MKVLWVLLSFALVGTTQSIFAEEQRTVTICNNNIPNGCAINGSFPPREYATCRGRSGSPDQYHSTVCRAKPGYIFWVGKCSYSKKYVSQGRIGDASYGGTQWCLRRDADYEAPFVEEPGSFQREPPPIAVNPDTSAQQTQNNNPVASATKEPQGQTPNDPFIYWTSRGVNVPLFGGLVFVILVLIGFLINKSTRKL